MDTSLGGWDVSAGAWIEAQGNLGDSSRREILDPCLDQLLGDVSALQILDVGCGEGRYARKLAGKGAVVTGIDPIPAFVERAASLHPSGTYIEAFGESLPLPDASFDLVVSYLSIVDIPDYRAAIREMIRVLRPDGRIVVATVSNMASTTAGWVRDASGAGLYRTVDRYMENFGIELSWSGIEIVNYHRPLSDILGAFFAGGVVLDGFYEPLPPPDSKGFADEFRVPTFQVMAFRRRN